MHLDEPPSLTPMTISQPRTGTTGYDGGQKQLSFEEAASEGDA
jgi:hypothetical protein